MRARRIGRLLGVLAAFGAGLALPWPGHAGDRPARVVSVDHCADQYLLALADPAQIAALSPDATAPFSYQAAAAAGLPQRPAKAETLLMARPDRVLRLWGGGPGTGALLARQDIPVTQLAHGQGFDVARENLRRAGKALGAPAAAQRLIARMDRRLERAARRRPPVSQRLRAVYVTPGGATAGAGTFIDAMLRAAGLRNVAAEAGRQGWHPLDLERLALDPPDVIVGGFFGETGERPDYWSIARHHFLRRQMETIPFISLPGRLLTCQAWYITEAVDRIQDRLAVLPGGLAPPQTAVGARR